MTGVPGFVFAALGGGVLFAIAVRARWLTWSGAAVALLVALALLLGEGLPGLLLLGAFFVTSSGLTKAGRRRGSGSPGRGDPPHLFDRDADGRGPGQVLANGGVAAFCSLLGVAGSGPWTHYAAAGALAAATADTWASEVGMWTRRTTRLVTTWELVEPGRSGGVSWIGSGAGALGASLIGGLAWVASGDPDMLVAMGLAGLGGMLADSWMGAVWEDRIPWIDNDVVNWLGTTTGALTGALLAYA
jgi:uncharacterized protein (TIGR00297 family)